MQDYTYTVEPIYLVCLPVYVLAACSAVELLKLCEEIQE